MAEDSEKPNLPMNIKGGEDSKKYGLPQKGGIAEDSKKYNLPYFVFRSHKGVAAFLGVAGGVVSHMAGTPELASSIFSHGADPNLGNHLEALILDAAVAVAVFVGARVYLGNQAYQAYRQQDIQQPARTSHDHDISGGL